MIPCDLYPVLPASFEADALFDILPALLAHPEVTALRFPIKHTLDKAQFSRVLALLHDNDVALMLDVPDGFSALSADLMKVADGLHAPSADSLPTLRKLAGDDIQIGCLCQSRDEAMLAGESGADYIAFAVDHAAMIRWWTSVMELPAGAENIQTVDEAATATTASADFLAIPLKLDGTDETLFSSLLASLQG